MIKNIGIIGLGSIGCRHLRIARELQPELNIIAVRSGLGMSIPEEKIADEIVYTIDDAIKSGIQAAIISTPAVYHIKQTLKLIKTGVHVLVEKPLSHSIKNVDELLEIEEKLGVVGHVGYCLRYDPAALKFRELLSNEKTGKILGVSIDCGSYLPNWRPNQDYRQSVSAKKELGGGVLLELSHELDYARWFFGDMISVYASLNNSGTLDIDMEDSADMIFDSGRGFRVSVHLDFNSRNIRRRCIVRCTKGDLIWDAVLKEVIWRPVDGPDEVESLVHDQDYIYLEQLKHFFNCIENNQSPRVTFEDGAAILCMVEAARESNAIGKKVAIS